MLESALILFFSLLLDQLIGEPRRYHPLVGFGWCVNKLEALMNQGKYLRLNGMLSVLVLLIPLIMLLTIVLLQIELTWVLEIIILYLAIGRKSLIQHALAVLTPLTNKDNKIARTKLSYIVSRDTDNLDKKGIITATIESVIENSNDAIFAVIFWYLVAGLPGVLCYRLVNTLDAMWGYKNERFLMFGWFAARLDDVMNWIPARLTVITFAVFGKFNKVLRTAYYQGVLCSSPNAGPVMAAGASSLNVELGGDAFYQQKLISKPTLGYGNEPQINDINRAIELIDKSLLVWLAVVGIVTIFIEVC